MAAGHRQRTELPVFGLGTAPARHSCPRRQMCPRRTPRTSGTGERARGHQGGDGENAPSLPETPRARCHRPGHGAAAGGSLGPHPPPHCAGRWVTAGTGSPGDAQRPLPGPAVMLDTRTLPPALPRDPRSHHPGRNLIPGNPRAAGHRCVLSTPQPQSASALPLSRWEFVFWIRQPGGKDPDPSQSRGLPAPGLEQLWAPQAGTR